MGRKDSRSVIHSVNFLLNLLSLVFFFIAFASPYWFQSWPRVYSPFKRIGLWEACFAGLVLPMDMSQKAYHGCWWILATEFKGIRQWLMPDWFIIVQVLCVLVFVMMIVNVFVLCGVGIKVRTNTRDGTGKKRVNITIVNISTALTIIEAVMMVLVVLLFGIMPFRDRNWMPYHYLNYLSWSYGFAVISAFFLIFSSISQLVFNSMERQFTKVPPTPAGMAMVSHGPPHHGVKDSSL